MPTSIDPALVTRLSGAFSDLAAEFTTLGGRMDLLGRDMQALHRQLRVTDQPNTMTTPQTTGASPETTASTGVPAPDAVPSSGVRSGGVYTPDGPGAGVATAGDAGPGRTAHVPPPPARGEPAAGHKPAAPVSTPRNTTAQPAPDAPHTGPALRRPGPATQSRSGPPDGPPPPSRWPGKQVTAAAYPPAPVPHPARAEFPRSGPIPPHPPTGAPGRILPRPPWWQREGVISRILAVAGVAVTLIGVVMLLVLAAQAGIFGPVPRVLGGAVLSAALVGAGMRVHNRAGGRVGGIALAATGFAGAYLDVVAVTVIYDWLHPVPGLAAALAVGAAGVGLAVQWRSQTLAVLVVAGAAGLAPFVTTELALLAFLIVLQLACVPVQYRYDWPFLHLVRTVPVVLAALATTVALTIDPPQDQRPVLLLIAAVVIAATALVGTLSVVRARPADLVASLTCALGSTPLLAAPALFDRPAATAIPAVYAAVLLSVAAATLVPQLRSVLRIPGHTALATAACGAFALAEACLGVTTAGTAPLALLLIAVGFAGVAGQARSRGAGALGAVFATLGGLGLLSRTTPRILAEQTLAAEYLTVATAATALTGLALLAVGWWALRRLVDGIDESVRVLLWIGAGVAALYLVATVTVSFAVAADGTRGFVLGHSLATIIWMATALTALLYGLRTLKTAVTTLAQLALGSGLLLTAAALTKLFLFDLATLDGVVRVAAFLVVGILLLIAGTRYARAFAESGTAGNTGTGTQS